jgi:hypothetical protein
MSLTKILNNISLRHKRSSQPQGPLEFFYNEIGFIY